MQEAQEETDRLKSELSLKEKQVRLQVLQVKKVKKQLKDLVLQDDPISLPTQRPTFQPSRPSNSVTRNNRRKDPSPLVSNRINDNTELAFAGMKAATKGSILTEDDALEDEVEEKGEEDTTKLVNDRLGINIDDPTTIGAATKLQAGYRGFSERKKVKEIKESNEAATKLQSRYRGYKDRKETKFRIENKKRMTAMEEQQKYEDAQKQKEQMKKKATVENREDKIDVLSKEKSNETRNVENSSTTFSKPTGRRKKKEKKKYY